MTVGELKKILDGVPDELDVVCFAPNGDGFTPDAEESGEVAFEQPVDQDNNPVDMVPPPNILALIHIDAQKSDDDDYMNFNFN
jgi:hypothetical protein